MKIALNNMNCELCNRKSHYNGIELFSVSVQHTRLLICTIEFIQLHNSFFNIKQLNIKTNKR